MQTLQEIRQELDQAGIAPSKRRGQCFLIDRNLMAKLVALADLHGSETVLEAGAGTGSLTEELLDRAGRVVAVEIDRRLHDCLRRRLGDRANLTLLRTDVLAGKHAISPAVLDAVAPAAHLVANLPYAVATPLIAECLISSYRAAQAAEGACRFDRLTFTVQEEVAERLAADCGRGAYGPVSVLVALLGRLTPGPRVPASAFWPRPQVAGRILRIDFDPGAAARLRDIDALRYVLSVAFTHRRKQIGWIAKHAAGPYDAARLAAALTAAGIDRASRPQTLGPRTYLHLANALAPS